MGYARPFVVDPRNDIRETAGPRPVGDPLDERQTRAVFFTGDYLSLWTGSAFHADALWRVDPLFCWMAYTEFAPCLVDLNGTGGAVPLAPRDLTVVPVSDGLGGQPETLFLFGNDDQGLGRLFAYRFDSSTSAGHIASTDLSGAPLLGLDIAPWINGVVFSALGEDGMGGFEAVVATWTDTDGNGAFDLSILFSNPGGIIGHLTVDGAGNAARVLDTGDADMLYAYVGGTLTPVDIRLGEIDELQMASGHLVYRAHSFSNPGQPAPFDYACSAISPLPAEAPTDEDTGGIQGSGRAGGLFDRAISNGFVFEALANNGAERRLFVTTGVEVFDALRGGTRHGEGAVLDGHSVGTGRRGDTGEFGLFQVQADGTLTTLYAAAAPLSLEAEVLGQQVLFGARNASGNDILLHDAVVGTTEVLREDHLLGSASTIGSRIVFTARDGTRAENSEPTRRTMSGRSMPSTAWRLSSTSTSSRPSCRIRSSFQGSTAGGIDVPGGLNQMRIWTWDGLIPGGVLAAVTGEELRHPLGYPERLATIGDEVFFLALRGSTGRPSIFQVEDDGVTATPILHPGFLDTAGLRLGGDGNLYFVRFDEATGIEYRVVDVTAPGGARLLLDANQDVTAFGYAPQQVVFLPDAALI